MEGRAEPPELRGIIPNSFQHIFESITLEQGSKQFLVRAAFLEIYNGANFGMLAIHLA